MKNTLQSLYKRYSYFLGGDQPYVTWIERIRLSGGIFVGLLIALTVAKYLGELSGLDEWLMASLGASAFLVFILPSSPMAKPWAVIAGNTLSACIGIAVANIIDEPLLAMPLAASLSVLGMFMLRCLHPPAAAVALIAVIGHVTYFRYALFPVMIDSILLVSAALIYNNLTSKRQ
jgi:CBS domain-containing membrane protein